MTEQNKTVGLKNSARRKLVRGAFGVPAVLTLHSGGAFAATSAVACLVNQNRNPLTVPASASDDTYFRYRLWVIRKKTDNSIYSSWIRGADLTVYAKTQQLPFVSGSSWWQFNPATNTLAPSGSTSNAPSPNGSQTLEQTGVYVALRIDANGDLVGAGVGSTGSAVADTCWNSFALRP